MTREEIEKSQATDKSTNAWLREIALQLAISNEKKPVGRPPNPK